MITTASSPVPGRYAAFFLILQYALMLSAFIILSSSINWPISLDDPADIALPRVLAQSIPMTIGYICYGLVALLLVPATAALNARLGITGALAGLTLALAAVSAMAKLIGICRWLFAMPVLAQAYTQPGADTATLGVLFDVLNGYAGSIGEIIGVGLVSGIWTIIMGAVIFMTPGRWTRVLGGVVIVTAVLLLLTVPGGFGLQSIFGIPMDVLLTINGFSWQHGLLAVGLWCLTTPRHA
jgi:Domain of unknown function (DUF4386)